MEAEHLVANTKSNRAFLVCQDVIAPKHFADVQLAEEYVVYLLGAFPKCVAKDSIVLRFGTPIVDCGHVDYEGSLLRGFGLGKGSSVGALPSGTLISSPSRTRRSTMAASFKPAPAGYTGA